MTDASTRRAFALDSRTVWVEQQIVNSTIIARDNFVLGPGEYNAQILERHISTPSIGGSKKAADYYPSFRSDLNVRTPLGKGSPSKYGSPSKRGHPGSSQELRDFSTVCLDNGERQPFDPKNGFCPTPGSYLSHGSTLRVIKNDGVYETKSTVPFGANALVPFGERCPTKKALPDYDPRFDSNQLRPTLQQGSFQKQSRIFIPTKEDMRDQHRHHASLPAEISPVRKNRTGNLANSTSEKKMSVFEMRCSLVPMPKLKHRTPPVLVFDDSSYRNSVTSKPLDLNPKLVNEKAKTNIYEKIVAIPRKHHSTGVAGKLVVSSPGQGGSYSPTSNSSTSSPLRR